MWISSTTRQTGYQQYSEPLGEAHRQASKKEMSKEQKKELNGVVKRAKKALKSKNHQLMTDCAGEIESLLS